MHVHVEVEVERRWRWRWEADVFRVHTGAAAGTHTERKPDVEAREERQGTCGVLCVIGEGGSGKTSASIAILSDLATSARKSESTSNEDTTDKHKQEQKQRGE